MATVFRIEKQKNYTVMSNHHLKDATLSLKAKGLLSQMLSLPENWDYSLKGLAKINKESVDAIRTAVWELEKAGYIVRSQGHGEHGKFAGTEYIIYETPQIDRDKNGTSQTDKNTALGRENTAALSVQISKPVDTHGVSPWLENPTTVKNPGKIQPNISPTLDFPTSDNPTSANPISEQLNTKNNKYINILNNLSISQKDGKTAEKTKTAEPQMDGQTDFTQVLEILEEDTVDFETLLADCDLDCLPEKAQPLVRAALEKMYFAESLKIGGVTVPQDRLRARLKLLDGDILQEIYSAFKVADTADKPVKNHIGYLISMIYNNSIQELAAQDIPHGAAGTIELISRGYVNPQYFLNNDNPAVRAAAERKAETENSG